MLPDEKGMSAMEFIVQFKLYSRERHGVASRSELRRWFKAGNIWINGRQHGEHDEVEFPVTSCIIFPKGKRITLK